MPPLIIEPIFLPNAGIDISKPEQLLLEQFSPYSRNMEFYNERLRGRSGLGKFDTQALQGEVLLIDQYWKFTSSYELIVCTEKDITKYDFSNTRYDYLNRLYTTGTIEIDGGTPTIVTGSGTSWSANLKAGDFIKIGSGSVHTGSTWYEIDSVDSDTQLTLTAAAATTSAGTAYVARITFTGGSNDLWQARQFLDAAEGEVWIATNGVDLPIWYNGTGQVQLFSAYPTDFTAAKYIEIFYDRIIFGWTVEGGQNQPIRVRWSAVANFQSYTDAHFVDLNLPTAAYWLKGFQIIGNVMVVQKEYRAYMVSHVGGDTIFQFDFASSFEGNFSAYSALQLNNGIFYFGYDNRFRFWNVIRDDTPFDDIFDYTIALDPSASEFIYGYQVEGRKQLRWVLPYDATEEVSPMIVFDYGRNITEIWDYELPAASAIRCVGEYLQVEDLYVDDADWAELYVDEQVGYWDDRQFLANAPVILYGCKDGIVRKADFGNTDDGTAYNRIFRTKRLDFRQPHIRKRLFKQQFWFDSEAAGSVTLKMKRNDADSYEAETKSLALQRTDKDIAKPFARWDKAAEVFQLELTAQNHFELIGFMNWFYLKGKFKKTPT